MGNQNPHDQCQVCCEPNPIIVITRQPSGDEEIAYLCIQHLDETKAYIRAMGTCQPGPGGE